MTTVANDSVTPKEHAHLKGISLVLLAGVFWSTAGIIVRLIESAHEWQIVFYRSLALVLTLLVVLVARNGRAIFSAFRKAGINAIVGGLCLGSGFACWIFSLTHTTVANALFLLSTAPFLTAILARIVIGERVARATWLAMTVALLGVAVMVGEGMVVGTLFGSVMGLTAALAFSGFTVALRLYFRRELMLLHVDTTQRRAVPFAPEIQTQLVSVAQAHAELPRPTQAGRSIAL